MSDANIAYDRPAGPYLSDIAPGPPQQAAQPAPVSTQQGNYQGQPQGTAGLKSYYNLYNAGVIQPNNALIDQQVHSLNAQLGLISAGNANQADYLNKNADYSIAGNQFSRLDLATQQNALNRQFVLQPQLRDIQRARFGVQQGDINFGEQQLGQYEDISRRGFGAQREQAQVAEDRQLKSAQRNAAVRGALQTQGYGEQVGNIVQDLNFALGNIGRQEEQANLGFAAQQHSLEDQQGLLKLTQQEYELNETEKQHQMEDANAYLSTQAQRLNMSDDQIKSNLQNALNQLGLNNALSVEQVAAQIAQVKQGKFSPIGGLLTNIQQMAGLSDGGGGGQVGGGGKGTPDQVSTSGDVSHPYGGTNYGTDYPIPVDPFAAFIIQHESGGDTGVQNNWDSNAAAGDPSLGIGQLTLSNRQHYGAQLGIDPNSTDFGDQYAMMTAYVNDRYGGWDGAKAYWDAHSNY